MIVMRIAVIGLVALAALTGCAASTGSMVGGSNGNGMPSPSTVETHSCAGWYAAGAGVCDSMGD